MILVSAAIIRNTAGEILICQRGAGGSCAFYGVSGRQAGSG